MKIRGDLLKISSGALNLKGEKLEPEEQLVRREVTIEAPVKHGFGAVGTDVGNIPATIVTDQTAGEQAAAMRALCGNCKHFRNDLWLRDLAKADAPGAPIEKRRMVNKIRAAIIQTQNVKVTDMAAGADGDIDVEHALRQTGYCMALYAYFKNAGKADQEAMTLVHPLSSCPQDVRSVGSPYGFFQASREGKEAGDRNHDAIMQRAAGKS